MVEVSKNQQIRDLFYKWDPEGFIKEGAPRDEYDAEADEVYARLYKLPELSRAEVSSTVYSVFVEYLETESTDFKSECDGISDLILEIFNAK